MSVLDKGIKRIEAVRRTGKEGRQWTIIEMEMTNGVIVELKAKEQKKINVILDSVAFETGYDKAITGFKVVEGHSAKNDRDFVGVDLTFSGMEKTYRFFLDGYVIDILKNLAKKTEILV
jgi:hypothetical protein